MRVGGVWLVLVDTGGLELKITCQDLFWFVLLGLEWFRLVVVGLSWIWVSLG